ncbi:MAG: heavy metal-responsive transcriptional regulator [Deinococcus sp.]|nr:heavy metal-responsive transcriptional regulator [Deinococcus sp.]
MFIGKLAEQLDLNPKTIRYYEQVGLLSAPKRTESGYRLYGKEDANRLRFIKKAKAMGLSLEEIKEIIDLRQEGQTPCRHVRALLAAKIADLDQRIQALTVFRDDLARYAAQLEDEASGAAGAVICGHIERYPKASQSNQV